MNYSCLYLTESVVLTNCCRFYFTFRQDHAVVMARFARECLTQLNDLTRALEVSLGPDTADLAMRVGLHSGPGTLLFIKTFYSYES